MSDQVFNCLTEKWCKITEVQPLTVEEEYELRAKYKKGQLAWAHGALLATIDKLREELEKK